jgi:hypothetical protein
LLGASKMGRSGFHNDRRRSLLSSNPHEPSLLCSRFQTAVTTTMPLPHTAMSTAHRRPRCSRRASTWVSRPCNASSSAGSTVTSRTAAPLSSRRRIYMKGHWQPGLARHDVAMTFSKIHVATSCHLRQPAASPVEPPSPDQDASPGLHRTDSKAHGGSSITRPRRRCPASPAPQRGGSSRWQPSSQTCPASMRLCRGFWSRSSSLSLAWVGGCTRRAGGCTRQHGQRLEARRRAHSCGRMDMSD